MHQFGIAPDTIKGPLEANQVFVFGSNQRGRHGAGAALFAHQCYGALEGQGYGLQGQSFAVPTKDMWIKTLPIAFVQNNIRIALREMLHDTSHVWIWSAVGCGLAGLTTEDVVVPFMEVSPEAKHDHILLPRRYLDTMQIVRAWEALRGAGLTTSRGPGEVADPLNRLMFYLAHYLNADLQVGIEQVSDMLNAACLGGLEKLRNKLDTEAARCRKDGITKPGS